MRSSLTARLSLLRDKSNSCLLMDGSPTSTGIMASVPYVRLCGVSCMVVGGCIDMPTGLQVALLSTFLLQFRAFSSTHLRGPCWPFVCGCSTELVTDLMSRSS